VLRVNLVRDTTVSLDLIKVQKAPSTPQYALKEDLQKRTFAQNINIFVLI